MKNMRDRYLITYQSRCWNSKYTRVSSATQDTSLSIRKPNSPVAIFTTIIPHPHAIIPNAVGYILLIVDSSWPQFILSCSILIFCLVSFCWFVYKYSTRRSLSKMTSWSVGGSTGVYVWLSNYHTQPKKKQDSWCQRYMCNEKGSAAVCTPLHSDRGEHTFIFQTEAVCIAAWMGLWGEECCQGLQTYRVAIAKVLLCSV